MNHHRAVLAVVRPCVLQLETLGQVVVDLDGAQLPTAANRIADHEVELGAVERRFAQFHHSFEPLLLRHFLDCTLRFVPVFFLADVLLRLVWVPQTDLHNKVLEVEGLEDVQDQIDDLPHFFLHLVRRAENVRVVLSETTHPREAMKFSTLLVAVHRAKFRQPHGQVAVRPRSCLEDFAVVRAIHRFEQILFPFGRRVDGLKAVLAVLGVVA